MGAPLGNEFWKRRTKHGAAKGWENDGEGLWKAACKYFEWVEKNPMPEEKVFCSQGEVVKTTIHKMRPMTLEGLCLELGIGLSTWRQWRRERKDISSVIEEIDHVIYVQKFSGAAADQLNANIIARDLKLSDKTDLTSSDGSMTPTVIKRVVVDASGKRVKVNS